MTNKKILMLLASERFRDIEFLVPYAFFKQAELSVDTTATTIESTGRFGYKVKHSKSVQEIDVLDYDALFIVGGAGILNYTEVNEVREIVHQFHQQKKWIAAICAAPRLLLSWNLLENQEVCGNDWDGQFVNFAQQHQAIPVKNKNVTFANQIITADGPEASEACALLFIEKIHQTI